ncbi:hypothetical protein P171DRAFT_517517 [Karstenula rhodostoma CBS 690.94]|uniref:Uncharacterized protein n=1 Tax=Karstenula rhodostoma CBS 690.94 TaxID=1392251 RepID=A0A9P4PTI6_9PLEO|nr:hypothetical protein P171DRAFT_517517 [Karstenula rhodostoma CBS 690.94]
MRSLLPTTALLAAALANPIPNAAPNRYYLPLTVTLFNNVTGAHAAASIDTSGHSFDIGGRIFRGSALERDGKILATSVQMTFPDLPLPAGNSCGVYSSGGQTIGDLDAQHTYLEVDGQPGRAVETDVTGFVVKCDIYVVGG